MKNIPFLLLLPFLASCSTQYIENITIQKDVNRNCIDMEYFKVFQVLEENYALANKCNSPTENYCFGPVVLLTPQRDVDYYDDMYVSLPDNKCAVQDGTYQYETKSEIIKTVPRIRWEYKYKPENKEDALVQLEEYLEDLKGECKLIYSSEKKTNTQSILNKCDCTFDEMLNGYKTELIKDQNENFDFETFNKELFKDIEKKCGKLPDIKK